MTVPNFFRGKSWGERPNGVNGLRTDILRSGIETVPDCLYTGYLTGQRFGLEKDGQANIIRFYFPRTAENWQPAFLKGKIKLPF
jgi:hypothetical protein